MDYKTKYAKDAAEGQVRKQEFISRSQDTKELSIRIAAAQRDSVLVSINRESFKTMADEEIKAEIEKWRAYFFKLSEPNQTQVALTEPF